MRRTPLPACLLPLLLASASAWAQEQAQLPPLGRPDDPDMVVRAFWEDDGSFVNPVSQYDRHYTTGEGIAILGRPAWLEPASEAIPFWDVAGDAPVRTRSGGGLEFVQQVYTPQDLSNTKPIPGDMAFAGYFYGGVFWQRETDFADQPDIRTLEHVELQMGLIGPNSQADAVQTFVHKNLKLGTVPTGWVNQLEGDNDLTAQVYIRRKWAITQDFFGAPHNRDYQWDLVPESTLALGTIHDYAEVGCTARFGVNLPHDFGPPRLTDPGTPGPDPQGSSFYVYARTSARVVAHDTFTDGLIFNPPTPGAGGSDIHGEPVRADATFGLRWAGDWGRTKVEFGYGLTFQTKQFREQTGQESYGAFQLGITVRF